MMNLDIKLYGSTSIYADNKKIEFSFMKAALLLIILSDKKSHSRKKLKLMLWHDKNEEKADRNLRNTIYVIKQELGFDAIISEKNARIRLNENIKISSDISFIDSFDFENISNDDLEKMYAYFSQDIFEDINFNYGSLLDDYIRNMKIIYNENIYRKLSEIIVNFIEKSEFENVISTANFMIKLNEYDEKIYIYLIDAYKSMKMIRKVVEINDKMNFIFGNESKNNQEIISSNEYYRDKEIIRILSEITNFKENKKYKHIGIKGLGGSGKSEIINSIKLDIQDDIKIIRYNILNGYVPSKYEVFNNIINKVRNSFILDSTFTYEAVAKGQKILLVIDNLDHADEESLGEIFNFVLRSSDRILLIATYSTDFADKLSYFINCLLMEGVFTVINLENIGFEDLRKIYLNLSDDDIYDLLKKSGGNPFLINYIMGKGVSKEMYTAFMNVNLSCKSETSIKILKLISAMQDSISLEDISDILLTDIDIVVEKVSSLIKRGILHELENESFTNVKFYNNLQKEYIYSTIGNIEKEHIHKKIAKYYESKLCDNYSIDNKYYIKIIYHFSMSKDKEKAFEYKCMQFNKVYNISHEFFPVALDEEYTYLSNFNIQEDIFKKIYDELICEMESLKNKYSKKILKLKINMFFSYARFYKSIGKFEYAKEKLEEILILSEKMDYFKGIYKVYLQFVQYAININDMAMMKYYIKKIKEKCKDTMDEIQYATYLRLKGYYDVLNLNFKAGIKNVEKAEECFKNLPKLYKMKFNIAACNFIKGEAKLLQNELDDAFDYYMDAISLCHDKEIHPSLALLFSRLGLIKLKQNSLDEAKYYLEKSLKQYDTSGFFWGKQELYNHLSEVYKLKEEYDKYEYYKKTK